MKANAMTTTTTAKTADASPAVHIPSWTTGKILGLWAAAALPMGALAWLVAPALSHVFSGDTAFVRALIVCLAAGLIWQFALVMIVLRREQGTLRWPVVKAALWLTAPTSPRTGKRGGKLWWLILVGALLLALEEMLPSIASPVSRDLAAFFGSSQGQAWMSGNWGWFAILIVLFVFNTVLGEELLFRGLMLPRMARFGRADWVVNGVLFACYHLHEPWVIPQTILVDTFAESGLSRRYRSALLGIAVHSTQTLFFMIIGLTLVLK
jgi:membrane protease YdiL (CAAX protease family)